MTQPAFSNAPLARHVLAPEAYADLLARLVREGRLWGKTAPVFVHSLEPKLVIVTTKLDGGDETRADVLTSGLCLVFDAAKWPDAAKRNIAVREIFVSAAHKLSGEKDWNDVDWRGADLWTLRSTTLESDYQRHPTIPDLWTPRADAARLVLKLDHNIRMPVLWGTFDIDAQGMIAVRDRHVPDLVQALDDIAMGRMSAEEALYAIDHRTGSHTPVSRFDIYGMYPGFLEENYLPLDSGLA